MRNPKTIIGIAFMCVLAMQTVCAQELTGKELVKNDDVNSMVESGIGLLFGAKSIEGKINSVKVSSDAYNKLELIVQYEGFENNWLKASFLDAEKKVMNDIQASAVNLTSGKTESELVFTLIDKPQNEVNHSISLKLMVCKRETDATGKVFTYQLNKDWKLSGLTIDEEPIYDFIQEGELFSIQPVAVGSAAQLKDAKPNFMPLPVKTSRVIINKSIYKTKIERKPMAMNSVRTTRLAKDANKAPKKDVKFAKMNYNLANAKFVTAKKEEPAKKSDTSAFVLHKAYILTDLQLNKEQVEKGAKGPGNTAIVLWDEIRSDVNFDFGETSITNISTDIFPDINENSGFYYYYPAAYNLKWDKDESYDFKVLYGSASEGDGSQVNMFLQLTPAVGTKEKAMVQQLVKDYAQKNDLPFEKLLPVPLASKPKVDLSSHLSNLYDVPSEKVSTTVSGLFDPVGVAWPMDSKKADDLIVGLKEVDLNGGLKLVPQGEMPEINVPVRISLDDENVLGRIELKNNSWRNSDWKNEMPFPVKLKYIHAFFLSKEEGGSTVPFIYSWSLGDKEIPVLASAKFNASVIPKIVDEKAQRIWVEYSVPSCNSCKDKILNELTGGTTKSREQKIELVSYVKERTNAYVIEVKVRSKFADTKGEQIIELPAQKIKEDDESYYLGPLYVPEGEILEYEFKFKIVTDDDVFQSDWIYSKESSLYLTKKMVADALGKFPGE